MDKCKLFTKIGSLISSLLVALDLQTGTLRTYTLLQKSYMVLLLLPSYLILLGLGKPIIRIRDLKEQAFVTFTTEEHPKGHLIQPGDIVVGMDGEFRPYIWGNEPAWLNQRVCIFESNRPKGKAFVLYTIKPLLNKIEQTQVATTVIHIGKKDFDAFEIVLPDEATLDSFDSITAPMIEKIVNNNLQNKRLAVLQNTLLPKLMSGALDVSNIDF